MTRAALVVLVLACACRRTSPPAPVAVVDAGAPPPPVDHTTTLLGGERGLDHVGIAVRDLDAATRTYHERLGFSRPVEGRLPNGIRNVNYYFPDGTYLETLVPWDRRKASWLADFTDHHSGALFAVLSMWSPGDTTAFLARRNIRVGPPVAGSIEVAGQPTRPAETWQTLFLPPGVLAGDPLYFIAYPRAPRDAFLHKLGSREVRRLFYHDNTALGLRAVWIAVPDLDAATRAYESIGLPLGAAFTDPRLDARGRVFDAGNGGLWLLAPASPRSPVAAFLRERGGPGILGVTLHAGSIPAATRLLAERTGRTFPSYDGLLGNSIRVPPDLTHGVWLELAQYLVPPPPAGGR